MHGNKATMLSKSEFCLQDVSLSNFCSEFFIHDFNIQAYIRVVPLIIYCWKCSNDIRNCLIWSLAAIVCHNCLTLCIFNLKLCVITKPCGSEGSNYTSCNYSEHEVYDIFGSICIITSKFIMACLEDHSNYIVSFDKKNSPAFKY